MNRGFISTGACIKAVVLVLLVIVIAVGVKNVTANDRDEGEREEETGYREIEVVHMPKAEETPYPDFDLYNLSVVKKGEPDDRIREDCGRADENDTDATGNDQSSGQSFIGVSGSVTGVAEESNEGSSGIDQTEFDTDNSAILESEHTDNNGEPEGDVGYENESDGHESNMDFSGFDSDAGNDNSEPELTYLGIWTATAYCSCPICCGDYSSGYTASGTLATEGRTVACNSLPFGTQLMIDGVVYTVEDTGYSPYGDAWVDLFFDSHDSALAYGLREVEVYLVN